MKLKDYREVERAAGISRAEVGRIGTAILFIVGVIIFTGTQFGYVEQAHLLIAAAVIGAHMAMKPVRTTWRTTSDRRSARSR